MIQFTRQLALVIGLCVGIFSLTACEGMGDIREGLGIGAKVAQSYNLSDADMVAMARKGVAEIDNRNQVAPKNSKYGKRLSKLTKTFKSVNGQPLNFKVYRSEEVNAFAMPDGSIRVYSGLMDKMNDDELAFVIGHEIGHVAKGHSKKRFKTALLVGARREALGNWGGQGNFRA